jgi:hypothetical protein
MEVRIGYQGLVHEQNIDRNVLTEIMCVSTYFTLQTARYGNLYIYKETASKQEHVWEQNMRHLLILLWF